MKTAKKLFSLLLVAVLMLSAIPFQASAAADPNLSNYVVRFYGKDGSVLGEVPADDNFAPMDAPDVQGYVFKGWQINGVGCYDLTTRHLTADDYNPESGKNVAKCTAYYEVDTTHKHDYPETGVVTPPTCTADGYTTYSCQNTDTYGTKGDASYTDTPVDKLGHDWGDWTAASGNKEVRTCKRCQETEERDEEVTVVFNSSLTSEHWDYKYTAYQKVTELPTPKKVVGKKFTGWFDEAGVQLRVGDTWSGQYRTYAAKYVDSVEDGVSTISVYVRRYVGGVQQGDTLYLYSQVFDDGADVLSWLQNNQSTTVEALRNKIDTNAYEWTQRYYYNYSGDEPLTSQDLVANGDKSIVIKVYATDAATANVLLYVHNTVGSSPAAIYEMKGYTAGNTVTLASAKSLIKDKTGKTYTVEGLYTDEAWSQKINGQKPTAANGVYVADNGTMKIHVLVSGYTASTITTNKSTGDNPATGDTIMMTVSIMILSGAAFVTLTQLRKRKMF